MSKAVPGMVEGIDTEDDTVEAITKQANILSEELEELEDADLVELEDVDLVELRDSIKKLESVSEETRKETIDSEVKNRVEPGDSLLGLSHIESHRKYLQEDVGTVIGRAANRGIDYTEFVSVKESTLAEEYPDLAEIGKHEYTYLR